MDILKFAGIFLQAASDKYMDAAKKEFVEELKELFEKDPYMPVRFLKWRDKLNLATEWLGGLRKTRTLNDISGEKGRTEFAQDVLNEMLLLKINTRVISALREWPILEIFRLMDKVEELFKDYENKGTTAPPANIRRRVVQPQYPRVPARLPEEEAIARSWKLEPPPEDLFESWQYGVGIEADPTWQDARAARIFALYKMADI